jgi:hypothetical protein
MDARVKPGHDVEGVVRINWKMLWQAVEKENNVPDPILIRSCLDSVTFTSKVTFSTAC